jgi:hypothetical protein
MKNRIQFNTLHRFFRGTHSSLIAVFSLFEFLHNFQSLVGASEGGISEKWSISWYENQLNSPADGGLHFSPEIKKYIKKWYMPEKIWKKILQKAENEYFDLLLQENIKGVIEKLLEKAKNTL